MGKSTPFEGELDKNGHPCCGQSFMGGTLCSLAPGHDGGCAPICQECDIDWYDNDGCACDFRCAVAGCDRRVDDDDDDVCEEHICWVEIDGRYCCNNWAGHDGPHSYERRRPEELPPPTQEELAETYRSLGAVPPMQ